MISRSVGRYRACENLIHVIQHNVFRRQRLSVGENQPTTTGEHAGSSIFAPRPRKRFLLLAFTWIVISAARGHYSEERGATVSSYVRVGSSIGLIPLFLVVLPFLRKGRLMKEAGLSCTLVCATACVSLFLHFSGELTLLGSVLMVIVRLSINVAAVIAFYLSTSVYPTLARCFGLGTCYYAFAVIGNIGDFHLFSRVLANHEDYGFGIMAFLLALASIAIGNLPLGPPSRFGTRMHFTGLTEVKHSVRQLDDFVQRTQPHSVVRHSIPTLGNDGNPGSGKQLAQTQPWLRTKN